MILMQINNKKIPLSGTLDEIAASLRQDPAAEI